MSATFTRPTVADPDHQDHINAVAETLEKLTGQQPNAPQLKPLAPTATLADVIAALNTLIARVS